VEVDVNDDGGSPRKRLEAAAADPTGMPALDLLIDVPAIQAMMDDFHALTSLPIGLIDLEGRVLVGTGWQPLCTDFHRRNPETLANCIDSDLALTQDVGRGESRRYKCQNGVWDIVTPLFVGDAHVGNIFVGQFFYDDEEPDMRFFEAQAERYGFDRDAYLSAVSAAPRFSHGTIDTLMRFYARLAEQITQVRHSNFVLSRTVEDLARSEQALRDSEDKFKYVFDHSVIGKSITLATGEIHVNDALAALLGYSREELESHKWQEITHPDDIDETARQMAALVSGERDSVTYVKRFLRKDGSIVWVDVASGLRRDPEGQPLYFMTSFTDLTERRASEASLVRASRALKALSGVNEALVRAESEDDLLAKVCEAVIRDTEYALVWVGYLEGDEAQSIVPVSVCGDASDYVADLVVSWGDGSSGAGPTGQAVRELRAVAMHHMDTDPDYEPWRAAAAKHGFRSSIGLPLVGAGGVPIGVLTIYSRDENVFGDDETELLAEMAGDLSYGIEALRAAERRDEAEVDLVRTNTRLEGLLKSITETMGKVIETRDPYTQGHERGVAKLSRAIAEEMGLPTGEVDAIEIAALVHDVGKLAVPTEILTKPGRLSDTEFALIKEHSRSGYEILRDIDFGWPIADIVLQHHERMDGTGYPAGLSGDDLLMASRILALADVVDAMASHRPYRAALGLAAAVAEVVDHPEKYDAQVSAAFMRLHEQGRIEL
jgi:PAS domain S-box-containing protein/putative nucleotidyltransferase with HDIG domain